MANMVSDDAPASCGPLQGAIQTLTSRAHRLPTTILTREDLTLFDRNLRLPDCYEGILTISGGVLLSPIRANQEALQAMARGAWDAPQPECIPFKLSTTSEEVSFFASVERLDARDGSEPALLFGFIHPSYRRLPAPERLMVWLGLSKTEASIAIEFAQGLCVTEIAQRRALSELTVRTHLRTIFEKSNTHRQPDLVALLLGLAEI